jgi:hypothetical protein
MTNHKPDPRPDQPAAAETSAREEKPMTLTEALDWLPQPPLTVGDESTFSGLRAWPLETNGGATRHAWVWQREQAEALAAIVNGTPALAAACLGTGTPGEPTPLDALQRLLDAAQNDAEFSDAFGLERADVEAVERLARELRVAVEKAEGEGS